MNRYFIEKPRTHSWKRFIINRLPLLLNYIFLRISIWYNIACSYFVQSGKQLLNLHRSSVCYLHRLDICNGNYKFLIMAFNQIVFQLCAQTENFVRFLSRSQQKRYEDNKYVNESKMTQAKYENILLFGSVSIICHLNNIYLFLYMPIIAWK